VGNTLAVHMIFGGLAVLLIPLQVSRMWRRGDRRKHVYLGWAMVPIVSIAALTTPPISFNMSYPFWSEAGFALGSVAWFFALVMGIYWIRKGDRERHRRWMVMMAALCFGAVSFRLQLPVLRLFFDQDVVFPYIGWTCWVPNVLIVAWWWQRDVARGTVTAGAPAGDAGGIGGSAPRLRLPPEFSARMKEGAQRSTASRGMWRMISAARPSDTPTQSATGTAVPL
jgi:uncharacterized membrane protein